MTSARQWREAANVLRQHAQQFDAMADDMEVHGRHICGVVLPYATPDGSPVACAFVGEHDRHSWAALPTVDAGADR